MDYIVHAVDGIIDYKGEKKNPYPIVILQPSQLPVTGHYLLICADCRTIEPTVLPVVRCTAQRQERWLSS